MARHPGISMHKLPVGADVMGAVFAGGIVVMFVVGIPIARWFLLGAAVFGALAGAVMIRFHTRHRVEITDLSALRDDPSRKFAQSKN